jgi:hypothetical protein
LNHIKVYRFHADLKNAHLIPPQQFNNMKNAYTLAAFACCSGLLSGCASIVSDDFQEITINTICNDRPVLASCSAQNKHSKWVFRSPATITVQNAIGELEITCKVDFGGKFSVAVTAMPSWTMAGNVLVGGLIGAAYDTYSGAGLKYPETINISAQSCK